MAEIKIRMTEDLRRKIETAAASRGVSMNAEMIFRLSQSFHAEDARKIAGYMIGMDIGSDTLGIALVAREDNEARR